MDKYIDQEVTITPTNSAYTANDVIGGLLTWTLAGSALKAGVLNSVHLCDDDTEGAALELWLFRDTPTTIANDAAFALAIADVRKVVRRVPIATTDYVTNNTALKMAHITGVNQTFVTTSGKLFGYLVCTGTPTYASGKQIHITLSILSE